MRCACPSVVACGVFNVVCKSENLLPFGNNAITFLNGIVVERLIRTVHDNFNAIFIVNVLKLRLLVTNILSTKQLGDQRLQCQHRDVTRDPFNRCLMCITVNKF